MELFNMVPIMHLTPRRFFLFTFSFLLCNAI
jgi:hypothetical protein